MTPHTAAMVFCVALIPPMCLQVALILGAPWGHLTLGGRYRGVLPKRARGIAALQLSLQALMLLVVASRGGLDLPIVRAWPVLDWAIWAVLVLVVMSCVGNWATPSRWERILWGPVTLVLLASVLGVILL